MPIPLAQTDRLLSQAITYKSSCSNEAISIADSNKIQIPVLDPTLSQTGWEYLQQLGEYSQTRISQLIEQHANTDNNAIANLNLVFQDICNKTLSELTKDNSIRGDDPIDDPSKCKEKRYYYQSYAPDCVGFDTRNFKKLFMNMVKNNDAKGVKLLIDLGLAGPTYQDSEIKNNPLAIAIKYSANDVIPLLTNKESLSNQSTLNSIRDNLFNKKFYGMCCGAFSNESWETMLILMQNGLDPNKLIFENNLTIFAQTFDDPEKMKYLLDHYDDEIRKNNSNISSALNLAIEYGFKESIQYLLDQIHNEKEVLEGALSGVAKSSTLKESVKITFSEQIISKGVKVSSISSALLRDMLKSCGWG